MKYLLCTVIHYVHYNLDHEVFTLHCYSLLTIDSSLSTPIHSLSVVYLFLSTLFWVCFYGHWDGGGVMGHVQACKNSHDTP